MRTAVRIMLVLAALAYGAMPFTGMAQATSPDMPTLHAAAMDMDCPHDGQVQDTAKSGHCAACLTLPAAIDFSPAGKPARAAQAPTFERALLSLTPVPPDRPPRLYHLH